MNNKVKEFIEFIGRLEEEGRIIVLQYGVKSPALILYQTGQDPNKLNNLGEEPLKNFKKSFIRDGEVIYYPGFFKCACEEKICICKNRRTVFAVKFIVEENR